MSDRSNENPILDPGGSIAEQLAEALREIAVRAKRRDSNLSVAADAVQSCYEIVRIANAALKEPV